MGRNLLLPYAIIAVLGILIVIAMSFVGVNQRDAIENPEEAAGENNVVLDAEDIFKNSCANCHGGDLTGSGSIPALNDVGGRLSEEDIKDIIINGTDAGMPGGLVNNEQAAELAEWLSKME